MDSRFSANTCSHFTRQRLRYSRLWVARQGCLGCCLILPEARTAASPPTRCCLGAFCRACRLGWLKARMRAQDAGVPVAGNRPPQHCVTLHTFACIAQTPLPCQTPGRARDGVLACLAGTQPAILMEGGSRGNREQQASTGWERGRATTLQSGKQATHVSKRGRTTKSTKPGCDLVTPGLSLSIKNDTCVQGRGACEARWR